MAASYCNNSAAKGYMMKRFPKNPKRQAVWVKCGMDMGKKC